ncbi:DIS3-like exonuclease 2 [Hydra vulgaris]|uniref:DIS3-like exonuclease 2 n=1 Tax=Hydra vulgaris TaxID=6087 RepID=A0ABM4CTV9_HYDVU
MNGLLVKQQTLTSNKYLIKILLQQKKFLKTEKVNPKYSKVPKIHFKPYLSNNECEILLEQGKLLKGSIQVFSRLDSFVKIGEGVKDLYIQGLESRNRALNGDIVAVQLLPDQEEKTRQKKAEVVKIIEEKHPRIVPGQVKPYYGHRYGYALMFPTDSSFPIIMLPLKNFPKDFIDRPLDFEKSLFLAKITNWDQNLYYASGKLVSFLGESGSVEAETEAIIKKNLICDASFQKNVLKTLPQKNAWCIPSEELDKRSDLRKECIFTIDPSTARDLDDALSCKKIADDLYEVGVHIADVSYFVKENSALDKVAQLRATSVYLTQKVIPMLPSILSEDLCSLNPGVDRLAYSIIFNLKSDGTIMNEKFVRSVICSQVKLTYCQAQQLIENQLTDDLSTNDFPKIYGGFTLENIKDSLYTLFQISKNLRKQRHNAGAISYNLPEIVFNLNEEKDKPIGLSLYKYKDSNKLIEEFMLLANMSVAQKIFEAHPKKAVLRRHPPPNQIMMEDLAKLFQLYELDFDLGSNQSINKSLEKLSDLENESRNFLEPAIVLMLTKPFLLASYFCSGAVTNEQDFHHYGLNVPLYTHFTSPIRRYPDILVHRCLTAALDSKFTVNKSVEDIKRITDHCNVKKYNADKASEESSELFFCLFLMQSGSLQEKGVVVAVLNNRVDVLCTRLGFVKRVYYQDLPCKHTYELDEKMRPKLSLKWTKDDKKVFEIDEDNLIIEQSEVSVQHLQMFASVDVILKVDKNYPTKATLVLKNPFAGKMTTLDL